MKILITGGAGFIGSSLAAKLLTNNLIHVVIIDNLLTGILSNIPINDNCRFIRLDVNDFSTLSNLMSAEQFDYVFHYAAVVGVKRTLDNPIQVLNDIQGIRNIVELSQKTAVKRIFFASSSEVYGEPVHMPQNEETTPLNSRLPYAVVKNVGEAFFKSYQKMFGLDYTIFRFFNTYGPNQNNDFVMSRFIRMAKSNRNIEVYGDGTQTRTFCYIDDNIEACLNCLFDNTYVNDVVNIGNDQIYSIHELALQIVKQTNSKSNIVFLPALPEGDMTRRQPDIHKMQLLLRRPLTSLEDGIAAILKNSKI
jgi:UDP-glucose 4-epimerase